MSQRVRTVPAILTDDPEALTRMVSQAETFTDYAQFDIMDGEFVPSQSVSCAQIAGLKTTLKWEAHLMVAHPEDCLEDFRKAGAGKIVFHYEAAPDPERIICEIKRLGMEAGIAINPETPITAITSLIDKVASVLFLSVNPGFYGAEFIPGVLETGIDGGVKESNIGQIARRGVNVIYVGSAIFLQPDPAVSYRRLKKLAEDSAI
jgi:ribulose-phosphate 3-epimerase